MPPEFVDSKRLLFGGRLVPLTEEVGFLESTVEEAADAFCEWQRGIYEPRGLRIVAREVFGALADMLRELLPLTNVETRRFLFTSTRGVWTAFFGNAYRGTDVASIMAVLATNMHRRAVRVTAAPGWESGGGLILEVWSPDPEGGTPKVRSIAFANDGDRIVSEAFGEPLPFEEAQGEEGSNQQAGFNFERLDSYLRYLGVAAYDEEFYAPDKRGVLIEKQGPTASGMKEFPLPSD
jgi:hypothetical protein